MEPTNETTTQAPESTGDTAPDAQKGDPALHAEGILKALTAERSQRKALADQLAEMQAADEARKLKAAEEQGRFEDLYKTTKTEAETLRERVAEYETREAARLERVTRRNAEAIEALPESYRGLVPDGLDPEAIATQIEKIRAIANADTTRHPTGAHANGGKPRGISEEAKREAVRMRVSPEIAQGILDKRKARQAT